MSLRVRASQCRRLSVAAHSATPRSMNVSKDPFSADDAPVAPETSRGLLRARFFDQRGISLRLFALRDLPLDIVETIERDVRALLVRENDLLELVNLSARHGVSLETLREAREAGKCLACAYAEVRRRARASQIDARGDANAPETPPERSRARDESSWTNAGGVVLGQAVLEREPRHGRSGRARGEVD